MDGNLDLDLDLDVGRPGAATFHSDDFTRPYAAPIASHVASHGATLAASLAATNLARHDSPYAASRAAQALPAALAATDIDFTMPGKGPAKPAPRLAPGPTPVEMDFDLDSLSLDLPDPAAGRSSAAGAALGKGPVTDFSAFELSAPGRLGDSRAGDSRLGDPTTSPAMLPIDSADPIARKLELADEFRQIGDIDGARDLLDEVVAKSSGTLKAKAQRMLDELG